MTKIFLTNTEIQGMISDERMHFPKYVPSILNLLNQWTQATRPKNVGQLSELIKQFPGKTPEEWKEWYSQRYPNAIQEATQKIMDLLPSLKAAISRIDEPMVRRWVEDLVINKTFAGLSTQRVILIRLSEHYCTSYKLASPEEEAKGIDGFIGTIPVSIKPQSYQSKALNEAIDVTIVFYKKKKNGIELQFDESAFLKL